MKKIKNIGILLTAILVAYILVFVRIESIITALEKNKDLEFSISKQGIEFISEEDVANDKKKEEIIRKYTISDIDIVTINAEKIEDGMIEKNKDIFNADKNMLIITKGKVYTYENNVLSKGIDIREELQKPILRNDILEFEDIQVGMELEGTVRNVAAFGAFVDIGIHDDRTCTYI